MKFFVIKVGNRTRRGILHEYISVYVSVSDDTNWGDVRGYFVKKYEGFEVEVEEASYLDLSEKLSAPEKRAAPKSHQGRLCDFRIKFTEGEKKIFDERQQLLDKANNLEGNLHRSIQARYKNLSYVNDIGYGMVLETDCYGTICKGLPINSDSFFKVVKDATEGDEAAEKLIVEQPGTSFDESVDLEIPF